MDIFGWLKSTITKLFSLFRKGAEDFVSKYAKAAKVVLQDKFADYISTGVPLLNWRDEAWDVINKTFNINGRIAGNWITLLVTFAYEMIKKEQEEGK